MAKPTKGGKTRKQKPSAKTQEQQKHPNEWNDDLNPDRLEGQNIGRSSKHSDLRVHTAGDVDVLADRLDNFSREELSQIPLVPVGTKLKQGAVYLDIRIPAPVPFTATADVRATDLNYYAPKAEIPYELWDAGGGFVSCFYGRSNKRSGREQTFYSGQGGTGSGRRRGAC